MSGFGLALPIVSLSEAQAYVRIETGEEEAVLAGLVRTASAVCESFIDQVVIARDFSVDVPASGAWTQVPVSPVRSLSTVEAIDTSGAASAVAASGFAIDIDASGGGWLRLTSAVDASRVRVSGSAGIAADQNGVPEPIRQGVLRLVAHLFAARDRGDGAPPAAVTALWRPYRRMRLA
jgi:uncharacterized phiE125 gp8 family phage protein